MLIEEGEPPVSVDILPGDPLSSPLHRLRLRSPRSEYAYAHQAPRYLTSLGQRYSLGGLA